MDKLSIGEMAKINNVSTQALRLYDKIGLLSPEYTNNDTGYRYYSIKQSAKLDMIQYMKALGMSLNEIKEQLDKQDIEIVKELLQKHRENIENQMKELARAKDAVERSISNYNRYKLSPKDGFVITEYIPKRRIYCYDSGINFYDYGIEAYEKMLRELKKNLISYNLPMVYFCNVGTLLRFEHLVKREFISTEVFLFVDDNFNAIDKTQIISDNVYLCIYCDSFYKEMDYANRLLDYASSNGMEIIGDYICEVVVELPVFNYNERNMFIKLQVPIKYK
jgi:DNA-binding transcriptional MerR regulator